MKAEAALKRRRLEAGWSQQDAAARLGVSQPYYSQLEGGTRPLPGDVAVRAVEELGVSPVVMPLPALDPAPALVAPDMLAGALGRLGYAGFRHLAAGGRLENPAWVAARVLAHEDVDVRIVEALPWLVVTFADLDWVWLVGQCRLQNTQNRLGYMVTMARQLAGPDVGKALAAVEAELRRWRLAAEGTLCRESMAAAERRWMAERRPAAAAAWGLLTTLAVEQLPYAA